MPETIMDLELQEKRALVTGASRGIGFGIARQLAVSGCKVMLCSRGGSALEHAVEALRESGGCVESIALDLSRRGNSAKAVEATIRQFGGIDILVNNVGGNHRKAFESTTDSDWDDLLELNFRGPLEAARAAIPDMKQRREGAIIFIASIYGREFGGKDMSLYHVSKGAVINLSKSLAAELAEHGIRVNTVAPGSIVFEGGSWDKRLKTDPEGMAEFICQHLPMGRFGSVQEIGDAVAFLASKRASLVTGTCWNVDGGQSRSMI